MELYLVRHGIAVSLGEAGTESDEDRMLSEKGLRRTRAVARALTQLDCQPNAVWSSPLPRARQTADIMAEYLTPENGVRLTPLLEPDVTSRKTMEWLTSLPEADALMLVGHMPGLERLASCLLTCRATMNAAFKKAAVMHLWFEGPVQAGAATLEWFLPPAILRKMG